MRKLLVLALAVAGGVAGYNYFLNTPPASAAGRAIAELERQFDSANQSMMQASRSTGISGLDTTADVEAARAKVRRVEAELQQVKKSLGSDEERRQAERLEEKIRAFRAATD